MGKRKFVQEDYEDEVDEDYVDSQNSDDDYEPSARENDNERPPSRSLRATQARSRHTTSGVRDRDGEAAQEGPSDGGAEVISEDNTSAAPRQTEADAPQVRRHKHYLSLTAMLNYLMFISSHILTLSVGAKR